jgi:rubrerythrin
MSTSIERIGEQEGEESCTLRAKGGGMDDQRLLSLLEVALRTERDGYQFYTLAADRSEDAGAREAFGHLAEEERRHYAALQSEYKSILDGAGWDRTISLGARWSPEEGSPIFTPSFRTRIAERHFEMSALSIGILLEKNAHAFYAEKAKREEEGAVRDLFLELADWENGHYQMLLREDEMLRDAYWSENRFSPLF